MGITEEKRSIKAPHNVILEDRKKLTVTVWTTKCYIRICGPARATIIAQA